MSASAGCRPRPLFPTLLPDLTERRRAGGVLRACVFQKWDLEGHARGD